MSRKCVAIAVVALLTLVLLPAAFADTNLAVVLHVFHPITVPGRVLAPGKYTVNFVNQDYSIVEIRDMRGNSLGLFQVIDASRERPTDSVEVDVQHVAGVPRIESWFLPGSSMGWQFEYPGSRAHSLAQADTATVIGE